MAYKNIILIAVVALFALFSQTFFKKGLKIIGELRITSLHDVCEFILKLIQNKFIIIGVVIAATGAFLWLMVISRFNLTTAIPITSGIFYILLLSVSWFFLGETITIFKILGIGAIILGIFLVLK